MLLLTFKCLVIFLLIAQIKCTEPTSDEEATVETVEPANSTITIIKYSNNGNFVAHRNITNHRIATYNQRNPGNCGGVFRNLQNLIESPKLISAYPICNLRCEYQIVSPYICENEFHIQFLDFSIDSSPTCATDKVIINYEEVLCGQVIGVKKYKTSGGVLNITFVSNVWDSVGKGFKLLITRLPCVEHKSENQTEIDSLEPTAPKFDEEEEPRCFHVNSSYSISGPNYSEGRPVYGVPYNRSIASGRQDIPVIPLPTPPPTWPPVEPTWPPIEPTWPPTYPPIQPTYPPVQPPIFPPVQPPFQNQQCCRNTYNQQRFLLISQGFPARVVNNNDCLYVIHRNSPNVCRLRINFKYFYLDELQNSPFGCINNFIEIDGQRMCGCKTNLVYETQWGYEPFKIIRLRTSPGRLGAPQGFVLDIIQEACPFKIQGFPQQQQQPMRKPEKLFLHPLFLKKSLLPWHQIKADLDEKFKSKFYQPEQNFVQANCVLNHFTLLQLKLETFGIYKHYCQPFY